MTLRKSSFSRCPTISENNYVASFTYNPEAQRAKMVVQQSGNTILARWYSGSSYVKETAGEVTKQYTYIGGDAYTAPVVTIKTGTGSPVYYYLLRDYLGSITHVVNTSKTTVAEYSYDAWGRMRNPTNWTNYAPGTEPSLFVAGRGFTGHEHMPWFNSINMNGRVYDPLIGQFLSPDNYVQDPTFTQNYNRYTYCFNNPLKYKDPGGYLLETWDDFWRIIENLWNSGGGSYDCYSEAYTMADGTAGGGGFGIPSGSGFEGPGSPYMLGEVTVTAEASNNNPYPPIIDKYSDPFRWDNHQGGEDPNYLGGFTGQGGNHGESTLLEYAAVAGYVSHGMIGTAAELTAQTSYKYGQRVNSIVKSAVQITAENKILWGTVAKGFNATGGIIGAGVNGYKAYNDYSKGNYGMAAFNGSKAVSYIGGTICLFIPGLQVVGGSILVSTLVIDVTGDVVEASTGH